VRNLEPDWEDRGAGMWECLRCGRLQYGQEGGREPPPPHLCSGMKRSRIKKVSPRKKEKREKRQVYLELHAFAKEYPCIAILSVGHVCEEPIDGHHVRTVGSGYGDWLSPRVTGGEAVGNVAAVCRGLHRELDDLNSGPKTVEAKYGIDLAAYAKSIGEDFLKVWQALH